MKKLEKLQIMVIVATLFTLLVNILADALPLNGQTTAEVSNQFDVYFVPAGYVFAIWGIIYLGLVAFSWYHAKTSHVGNLRIKEISGLYIGSTVANVAWLFFWHYNLFALTLVAMLALLVVLIRIIQKLHPSREKTSIIEKWMVDTPFEIYLGWICIASIANITDVLSYYRWDGFGIDPVTWALIMLTVGVLLVVFIHAHQKSLAIPIVFIWAYIGIGVKFITLRQYSISAWVMAILIAFMIYTLDLGKKIQAGSEVLPPGLSDSDRSK